MLCVLCKAGRLACVGNVSPPGGWPEALGPLAVALCTVCFLTTWDLELEASIAGAGDFAYGAC